MKMIGSTNKVEGLHHLVLKDKRGDTSRINHTFNCTIPDNALWNFQLGHISINRMQALHFIFPFIIVDQKAIGDV